MGFITPLIRPALSWGGVAVPFDSHENSTFCWLRKAFDHSVCCSCTGQARAGLSFFGNFQRFLLNQIYTPHPKKIQKIAISQVFLVKFSNLPVHLSFLKDVLTGFALHAAQAAELLERYCHSAAPFWHEKLRLYPLGSNEKKPGWLGYIGDYTTQVYRDYNKPL